MAERLSDNVAVAPDLDSELDTDSVRENDSDGVGAGVTVIEGVRVPDSVTVVVGDSVPKVRVIEMDTEPLRDGE